jgi:hypothetical protein
MSGCLGGVHLKIPDQDLQMFPFSRKSE